MENKVQTGPTFGYPSQTQTVPAPVATVSVSPKPQPNRLRLLLIILGAMALLIGLIIVVILFLRRIEPQEKTNTTFNAIDLLLSSVATTGQNALGTQRVTVNGSLVLSPSSQPNIASTGQIYYDQTSNILSYFNGTEFITLEGASADTGVTTIQGQTGAVNLTAGSGISISGTTITNNGVLSLTSGNSNLLINQDSAGNHTLTVDVATTLQGAYDGGNTINATDNRNIVFSLTDQATDPNFLIDLQCDTSCGANGRFAIQDDGTDVLSVSSANNTSQLAMAGTVILSSAPTTGGKYSFRADATTNNLTIGANIIGNASNDGGSDTNTNYIQSSMFNSGPGGTIDSVRVCFTNMDAVNKGFRVAVYSDNAGTPDARLSPVDPPDGVGAVGWATAPLGATLTLEPNTNYWIGFSMQVGITSRYCRQDGGITKYQGGFAWGADFPDTYNVTDVTTTTVAAYAPYITVTDHSALTDAITVTENNEVAIQPLYNSDTAFQVLRKDGSVIMSANAIDRYMFASQLMVGAPDTSYSMFILGNTTNGVLGARRTTNDATNSIMELFSDVGGASTLQFKILADGTVRVGNPTADSTGALVVLDTKNTSGDPTGINGAMYYNSATGTFRCYQDALWTECLGDPKPNTKRTTNLVANGSDDVMGGYGDILSNTGSTGGTLGANLVPEVYFDTGAVNGNQAGHSGLTNYDFTTGSRYVYQALVNFNNVGGTTSTRVWSGLTDQTLATMAGSATPAGDYAAFRYDTGAGDATYKCVTNNNTTPTVADSGVTPTNAQKKLEILIQNGSRAVFKIDGQTVCTVATTLPGTVTTRVVNSVTTLTNAIRGMSVGWVYVEGDPL